MAAYQKRLKEKLVIKHIMKIKPIITLIISSVLLFACGHSKDVQMEEINEKMSDKELQDHLFILNEVKYDDFYSKINVDFKSSEKDVSFKTSVKMRVDSAFSGTISYLNLIVGTYLLNKDSVYSTNKQDKCYFIEDITYISSIVGVELEYDFVEKFLLGKPIGVNDDIKYKQIKDKDKQYYILSSHSKHKFEQIEKDKINLDNEKNDDIYMQYFFTPDSLDLAKMHIEIPGDTVSIFIDYLKNDVVDGVKVPQETHLSVKYPRDSLSIHLDYSKVKINQPKELVFSVPEGYEDCNR